MTCIFDTWVGRVGASQVGEGFIPFCVRPTANQVPLAMANLDKMVTCATCLLPCLCVCMYVCPCVRPPFCRAAWRLSATSICLCCVYALIASYVSLCPTPPPPAACTPAAFAHAHAPRAVRIRPVDWPAAPSPRGPAPSCVALACESVHGRPWADWTGSLGVALLCTWAVASAGVGRAVGGWSRDGLVVSDGTSFGFWVDVTVARPVVWLRGQDLWTPRECFPHWDVSFSFPVLGFVDQFEIVIAV